TGYIIESRCRGRRQTRHAVGLRAYAAADAFDAGEIVPAGDAQETGLRQQLARRGGLVVAMFDPYRAANAQPLPRAANNGVQRGKSITIIGQRARRLEAQVAPSQMRVGCGDIWGVGQNQVESGSPLT